MKLEQILNERIADFGTLYIKLHRFHWFVEGTEFFPIHTKTEELYNEAALLLDEYAERLLTIDGKPIATLKEFIAISKISEDGNETNAKDIMNTLIKDYTFIVEELKSGITVADEAGDSLTVALFEDTIGAFQKHLWMFKQTVK